MSQTPVPVSNRTVVRITVIVALTVFVLALLAVLVCAIVVVGLAIASGVCYNPNQFYCR